MNKTQHFYFEQVVDGSLAKRNIGMLTVYKEAIDELAVSMSEADLKNTIVYQMYEYLLVETSDYLMEV